LPFPLPYPLFPRHFTARTTNAERAMYTELTPKIGRAIEGNGILIVGKINKEKERKIGENKAQTGML